MHLLAGSEDFAVMIPVQVRCVSIVLSLKTARILVTFLLAGWYYLLIQCHFAEVFKTLITLNNDFT